MKIEPAGEATPRPRSVLLAEDDDDLRRLLAETLRAEGLTVVECSNGLDLAEALVSRIESSDRSIDLIVSDVRMPGVSGLAVLEELSDWNALPGLPIIMISAFAAPGVQQVARRFGGVTLLEKPFEMTALVRVVRKAIDGRDDSQTFTQN